MSSILRMPTSLGSDDDMGGDDLGASLAAGLTSRIYVGDRSALPHDAQSHHCASSNRFSLNERSNSRTSANRSSRSAINARHASQSFLLSVIAKGWGPAAANLRPNDEGPNAAARRPAGKRNKGEPTGLSTKSSWEPSAGRARRKQPAALSQNSTDEPQSPITTELSSGANN